MLLQRMVASVRQDTRESSCMIASVEPGRKSQCDGAVTENGNILHLPEEFVES